MEVKLPNGETVECEVEMDGYKVLDVCDANGTSLVYDECYGLTERDRDRIYQQAERGWCDQQCDYADNLRDRAREEG